MNSGFEGGLWQDDRKASVHTRLECKICWYVYDPALGDDIWQIPPGVPFSELPEHWSCPSCDNSKDNFLVLDDEGKAPKPNPTEMLEEAFRTIEKERMQGLPFLNENLKVQAVGFRPYQEFWLGVIVSPWVMNMLLLPRLEKAWPQINKGETHSITFPAGRYEFIMANEKLFGAYMMCSLFSPTQQFESQEIATQTAEYILEVLFMDNVDELDVETTDDGGAFFKVKEIEPPAPVEISKRDFLRGKFSNKDK